MSSIGMKRAKCRQYKLPEAYAELMGGVQSHVEALERIDQYKRGLKSQDSTTVVTDNVEESVGNAAMLYDKIGRCLKCGKLTYKYWAICGECANRPVREE